MAESMNSYGWFDQGKKEGGNVRCLHHAKRGRASECWDLQPATSSFIKNLGDPACYDEVWSLRQVKPGEMKLTRESSCGIELSCRVPVVTFPSR